MLSNTSKYGIRAMLYLAQNNKPDVKIGIKKIAEELKIPTPFLGKILQLLAKHKLLHSTKGPHGGFSLAKDADEINLISIVEVLDGSDFFEDCLIGAGDCDEYHSDKYFCPVHDKFYPIKNQIKDFFSGETIGSLVKSIQDSGKKIKL